MSEYRVVIQGGDLDAAKKALEGLGAYNGWTTITGFVGSPPNRGEALLHICIDADDEGEVEEVVMAAPTPKESEIVEITLASDETDKY